MLIPGDGHALCDKTRLSLPWDKVGGKGRACELGLFVAPGALGVGLGCMFPMELYMISLGGFFLAMSPFLLIWPLETPETEAVEKSESIDVQSLLAAAVMTFCVFCRAASGFCTEAPWKASTALTILCFVLVMGGKMLLDYCLEIKGASVQRICLEITVRPAA